MSGLLIPNDWDEPTDGFCTLTVTVPNSPLWRANFHGVVSNLAYERQWDKATEDTTTVEDTAAIGQDILDSIVTVCP